MYFHGAKQGFWRRELAHSWCVCSEHKLWKGDRGPDPITIPLYGVQKWRATPPPKSRAGKTSIDR